VIKVLFDTSVLVASILVNHEQHSACIPWLTRVKRGEIQGFVGTHTLAELYSILSAFPAKPRLSPQLVQQLMTDKNAHSIKMDIAHNSSCTKLKAYRHHLNTV
jgi:predicted nucleic acid-binding protein